MISNLKFGRKKKSETADRKEQSLEKRGFSWQEKERTSVRFIKLSSVSRKISVDRTSGGQTAEKPAHLSTDWIARS